MKHIKYSSILMYLRKNTFSNHIVHMFTGKAHKESIFCCWLCCTKVLILTDRIVVNNVMVGRSRSDSLCKCSCGEGWLMRPEATPSTVSLCQFSYHKTIRHISCAVLLCTNLCMPSRYTVVCFWTLKIKCKTLSHILPIWFSSHQM